MENVLQHERQLLGSTLSSTPSLPEGGVSEEAGQGGVATSLPSLSEQVRLVVLLVAMEAANCVYGKFMFWKMWYFTLQSMGHTSHKFPVYM